MSKEIVTEDVIAHANVLANAVTGAAAGEWDTSGCELVPTSLVKVSSLLVKNCVFHELRCGSEKFPISSTTKILSNIGRFCLMLHDTDISFAVVLQFAELEMLQTWREAFRDLALGIVS